MEPPFSAFAEDSIVSVAMIVYAGLEAHNPEGSERIFGFDVACLAVVVVHPDASVGEVGTCPLAIFFVFEAVDVGGEGLAAFAAGD